MTKSKLYTPAAVAELFDVEVDTVWRWIRNGDIQAKNIGGEDRQKRYRIPQSAIDDCTVDVDDIDSDEEGT